MWQQHWLINEVIMQQFDLRMCTLNCRLLSVCLFFVWIWVHMLFPLCSLRSQVLPAGETGELHPAADPPEPLLRLPGKVWLQRWRPPPHRGWRSCDEAARHVDLEPTAVSSAVVFLLVFSIFSGWCLIPGSGTCGSVLLFIKHKWQCSWVGSQWGMTSLHCCLCGSFWCYH